MKKTLRIFAIVVMVLTLLAFGVYLAHPSKVKAGTLKLLGMYGLGEGLYPLSGSQTGEIKKMSLNGQSSLFLSCFIRKPARAVFEHYSKVLKENSGLASSENPSQGVFEIRGPGYFILGTRSRGGAALSVVIFPTARSESRYYLCRSVEDSEGALIGGSLVMTPPFSTETFVLEEKSASRGLYLYQSKLSSEKISRLYKKTLLQRGWKEWKNYGQSLQAHRSPSAMVFRRRGLQCLVSFQGGAKRGDTHFTVLVQPLGVHK